MRSQDFEHLALPDFANRDIALEYLGTVLRQRQVTLLLGAGVSRAAHLPDWETLVSRCEALVGLPSVANRSSQQLMSAIDVVRRQLERSSDPRSVSEFVHTALYANLPGAEYPADIVTDRMLIAIGAVVMSSARGSVGDVFTLNFDDVLEWYLALHGFRTQVVTDYPSYIDGAVDVTVFHPHGFVPLRDTPSRRSDWMVLSYTELRDRLAGGADKPWPTLLADRFMSKRLVALGTSMRDLDIDVILKRVYDVKVDRGPLGFVINSNVEPDRVDELLELGLVTISLSTHEEIPDFLLEVCRRAAAA